jgi:hypothetical protein
LCGGGFDIEVLDDAGECVQALIFRARSITFKFYEGWVIGCLKLDIKSMAWRSREYIDVGTNQRGL